VCAAYDAFIRLGQQRGLIDDRRAAIGFCFGGGNVLELARDGADLKAAVAIHSDLKTKAPPAQAISKAALLVIHGTSDPVVPKADREEFEAEWMPPAQNGRCCCSAASCSAYTDEDSKMAGVAIYDEPATRQTMPLTHAFMADAFAGRL